jgi:hypothetical protein
MLPGINNHQGNAGLCEVRLMIIDLGDQQSFSNGFPHEGGPAGSHDGGSDLAQLFAKALEVSEIGLNGAGKFSGRCAAACGVRFCQNMECRI